MSELQTHTQSIYKWSLESPQAIAIISGKEKYTYETVAINIARYIKAFECVGIKKGMLIGVFLGPQQRVFELILTYSLEAIGAIRITQLSENERV